jgi:hypothetical protein
LQCLAVELAGEGVQCPHDVGNVLVAMGRLAGAGGVLGLGEHARVGLLDHALAVVDPDQILLEDVVVEHVLGRLTEVDHPLAEMRRLHPVRHVLRVAGAGGVVVAADAADPAGDEVCVARILALHKKAVSTED